MAVHFVRRCHTEGPACKGVYRLEADTVLAWFQKIWADDADRVREALGGPIPGLENLAELVRERRLPPPESDDGLHQHLRACVGAGGQLLAEPHAVQVFSAQGDGGQAGYFF